MCGAGRKDAGGVEEDGKRGIKLVRKMRSQIFWQIIQKFRRHAVGRNLS